MRHCGLCGATPPDGFASITENGKQVWLCHPDDPDKADCYVDWQRPPVNLDELFRTLRPQDRGPWDQCLDVDPFTGQPDHEHGDACENPDCS